MTTMLRNATTLLLGAMILGAIAPASFGNEAPSRIPSRTYARGDVVRVASHSARVWLSGRVIGGVERGERFQVLATDDAYLLVRTGDGPTRSGWVHVKHVRWEGRQEIRTVRNSPRRTPTRIRNGFVRNHMLKNWY